MTLKSIIAASALFGLIACSGAEAPKAALPKVKAPAAKAEAPAAKAQAMATKTTAVLIYADWCGSCKILDPKLKEARGLGAIPGLDYVVLDYSAKDPADFYAQAEAAGVGAAVTAYLNGTIKTGQLVLVDMDDQKVLKKIDKTYEVPQMINAFKEAIAAS